MKIGKVVSAAGDKTIVINVERLVPHEKYKKRIRKRTKLHVHDPKNEAKVGDLVKVKEIAPCSKLKTWLLLDVLSHSELEK